MRKLLILADYSIYPPMQGGQLRTYKLAEKLSKYMEVSVITVSVPLIYSYEKTINSTFKLYNYAITVLEIPAVAGILLNFPISQATYSFWLRMACKYRKHIIESASAADFIMCDHSYLFPFVADLTERKDIIYNSHNVDYLLQRSITDDKHPCKSVVLQRVFEAEKRACKESKLVFATCVDDKDLLSELYETPLNKICLVPNGVDTRQILPCQSTEKGKAKQLLGLTGTTIVSFIGSAHPPNIEAVNYIIRHLAVKLKLCTFVIFGSVIKGIHSQLPGNVVLIESKTDSTKQVVLNSTDIAVNPMFSGSGTNLKMLEYLASGLPVCTSTIGARGISIENGVNGVICQINDMPAVIEQMLMNKELLNKFGEKGRHLVETTYDWDIIASHCANILINDSNNG